MKRSAALTPLSHDHHHALSLAMQAGKAARQDDAQAWQRVARQLAQHYQDSLQAHFAQEEHKLLPALLQAGQQAVVDRTLADHAHLHALLQHPELATAAILQAFADAMTAHVRFEERELFPLAESLPAVMAAFQSAGHG
jgi:hemerythrin-like domain-containing protein